MNQKITSVSTVAEQKQEFLFPKSANAFKSELLGAVREMLSIVNRVRMQASILTDDDLRPYTSDFNHNIQDMSDEMEGCVSHLMDAYVCLEKLDVRNTSVFTLD
ncbi:MAG: hypothetical protein OSJ36_05090 [Odoribacter sp.]|nr:hypothetical protein [Odoribacter sp.]